MTHTQRYGTTTLRGLWCNYACRGGQFDNLGGGCSPPGGWSDPNFYGKAIGGVPTVAVEAYAALERALMSEGYKASSVWSYNCRPIASSGRPSLHGFGIAIDIDPNENPQTVGGDPYSGKLKKNHIDAVMKIKISTGQSLWWWGGFWSGSTQCDRMHFQLDCTPAEAVTLDWSTVPGGYEEGDDLPNMSNEAQEYFQAIYESLKVDPDKPGGEKNPPGAKLFSYLASFHRWAVKKSSNEGTEYDTIVAKFLKDK